jgi:PilZ domain
MQASHRSHLRAGSATAEPMQGVLHVELRSEPRYNVFWRAQIALPNGRSIAARTRDISSRGLALVVADHLPQRAVLPLMLRVPNLNPELAPQSVLFRIDVVAVVLAGHEYRIGATWVDLKGDERRLIDRWLKRLHDSL